MTNFKQTIKTGVVAILAFGSSLALTQPVLAQTPTKTIYFLSGLKDHVGAEGTGRHETRLDLVVLQHCIDSLANVKGVKIITKFIDKRTALNVDDIKDASAIIVECSSVTSTKATQTRTHPLLPPPPLNAKDYDKATLAYLNQIDSLQEAGMGIMILHWGIATDGAPPSVQNHYLKWFGQVGIPNYTHNPLGYWTVTPIKAAEKHPILRGVIPWTYKDEIFSNLVVRAGDPYRTDLLLGEATNTNQGPQVSNGIASVYEKGKQRGALWGGMDYHSALLNPDYLRFVLNEILWTAGIDVPKGGAKTNAKQLQYARNKPDSFDKMKPDNFDAATNSMKK